MSDSLFDSLDEQRRDKLRRCGWNLVGAWGQQYWERPEDKAWFSEAEAFKQLARYEALERPTLNAEP